MISSKTWYHVMQFDVLNKNIREIFMLVISVESYGTLNFLYHFCN